MKEYLKLKKLLEEKKRKLLEDQKKSSRQQILNKMKQNRRMSVVEPEDNPDQKIEALQLLVNSNINDALLQQKPELLGSPNYNSKVAGQMSYVIPSAESLHMYNSQVEKPSMPVMRGGALQHSLPFLGAEPSQYNSQSVMINPPANIDLSSLTPSPLGSDLHSTLPFLQSPQAGSVQSVQPISFSSFINPSQSVPTGSNKPFLSPFNMQNNYGTSFVTPNSIIGPNAPNKMTAYHQLSARKDSLLDTPQQQNSFYQPVGSSQLNPNTNILNSPNYNLHDLDSHLRKAKEEQQLLESQLKQLQQVEANLKNNKMPTFSSSPFTTSSSLISSGSKVPKSLGGFPMNFEDMLTTGLELAKQSKDNSLSNQRVGEVINPRNFNRSPASSWNSVPIPQSTRDKSANQSPDGFSPSQMISQNVVHKPSSVDADQIHVIGPHCYVMTPSGFKVVGAAPACVPGSQGNKRSRQSGRSAGGPGSIWDSISSIPLVSKFTRTFGIK